MIREASIESLRACLAIIAQRDLTVRNKWLVLVFEEAERGLRYQARPVNMHDRCALCCVCYA